MLRIIAAPTYTRKDGGWWEIGDVHGGIYPDVSDLRRTVGAASDTT